VARKGARIPRAAVERAAAAQPPSKENYVRKLIANFARLRTEAADAGMSTAEYAVGTLAAVAFAGVLLKVVTGNNVLTALTGVIDRALK
jgi:NADH:ubiquinone oxidoreductase subunit D